MSSRSIVLEVNSLHVSMQTNRGLVHHAVQDSSFQIEAGKVLGIVGESGCGKSTTCMAILGLLPAPAQITNGSIKLRGKELVGLAQQQMRHLRGKELALILQNPMTAFNPTLTIGKQFTETLRAHQALSRTQAEQKAMDAIRQMGLNDAEKIINQYPFELSGGMLQRIMIALSISMKPSLLIADEPTTALDSVNRYMVMKTFQKIKEEGHTAILLVSHDLGFIRKLADEVIVMKEGRVVEMSDTEQILSSPQNEYTKMLLDARLTADSRIEQESKPSETGHQRKSV
ncbi:ABC transporter ATP-binding protein [Paenibacillus chitinolyticus]|uniref:ABC transporter ATP-binding protein n=1 Tax=Paenibacillus chitinolyticus TaxID=79263 RepID=A0A410WY70_9BACL|nr:ABC transporter ATP-binding protein [Paenibacillus chitinolyticus]MCY9589896.1 ABC transporter ATP-binding protein [Paenibacillus chitinolyticus]MCY9596233.1 ABC transporter ATP-binding protein [Paenibacillus chitinolyticus]QAV19267.1 ABC transporter ATP-binding protein [Paenibacillus chitinolyticus]